MWQCVFPSNYSDVRCQHAISKASSVGVNSHPAFDKKPGNRHHDRSHNPLLHMRAGGVGIMDVRLHACMQKKRRRERWKGGTIGNFASMVDYGRVFPGRVAIPIKNLGFCLGICPGTCLDRGVG